MKRIFSFVVMMFMFVAMMSAQTVEGSKFFENTYVGVRGGLSTPLTEFFDPTAPSFEVEVGKDFTPVIGLSVTGQMDGRTSSDMSPWVQTSNVGLNLKFNMLNMFGGYKGEPRRVEFFVVPGMGWEHAYADEALDKNYLTYNAFGQLSVNMGAKKAWTIDFKPGVEWNTSGGQISMDARRAAFKAYLGVTYKFGSKQKNSHNFVLCPFAVTQADYDKVVAECDALIANPIKETQVVTNTVTVTDTVQTVKMLTNTFVSFKIGSAEVVDREISNLQTWYNTIDKDSMIKIVGSADTKTGSKTINDVLSLKRAENVKKVFVEKFGHDAEKINTSNELDLPIYDSRVVVVTMQ